MTKNTDQWRKDVTTYFGEIDRETDTWKQVQTEANTIVKGALDNSSEATKNLTEESSKLKEEIVDEVIPAIHKEIEEVLTLTDAYGYQRTELQGLIQDYYALAAAIDAKIAAESQRPPETATPETPKEEEQGDNQPENSNGNQGNQGEKNAHDLIDDIHFGKVGGDGNGWRDDARKEGYSEEVINEANSALNDSKPGGGYDYDFKKAHEIIGYATGGYTGEWGPEGKLAFLHEKELVLNQDDTENLLSAVSFIREIVSLIDAQAAMSSFSNMFSAVRGSNYDQSLQQMVEIHAEFPNAVDHNEIEEAFNNLINTASQYANRKL